MTTTQTTRTALIIGITGSFGGAVARELLGRGWNLRALVRDAQAAIENTDFERSDAIQWQVGDALNADDMEAAAQGVDLVVDGFNVAYPDWDPTILDSARIVADIAKRQSLTVLFPGNVYGLGPDFSTPLAEDAPREAPSKKGRLRNRLEKIFEDAAQDGGQFIILRCGDFFGSRVPEDSSWMAQITKKAVDGGPIVYPGDGDTPHAWAYLPDAAHTAVELVERRQDLPSFAVFHFRGHQVDPEELIAAIRHTVDDRQRRVKSFPWWLLSIARPFSAMFRELYEMRYLWDVPLQLDDSLLLKTLGGPPQHTDLQTAIDKTLLPMMAAQDATSPSRPGPQRSEVFD